MSIESGLPEEIRNTERVCHFFFSSNGKYKNGSVLFSAFFPPVTLEPHELSVFRIDSLSNEEIWGLGDKFVTKGEGSKIKARADILVDVFRKERFVVKSDEPPPYHALILNWPKPCPPFEGLSNNQIAKLAWQKATTELARKAKLVERNL